MPGNSNSGPHFPNKQHVQDRICELIATGSSLTDIAKQDGFPSYFTILRWQREEPDFRNNLALAHTDQADYYAQECVAIADRATDRDSAACARVQIDTRLRRSAHLKPKVYRDWASAGTTVNVTQAVVVSPERRQELIERRRAMLEQQARPKLADARPVNEGGHPRAGQERTV